MADYNCWPLWQVGEDFDNIAPSSLPLSPPLIQALEAWADEYTGWLNVENPGQTQVSAGQLHAFEQKGLALWAQLQAELGPNVQVDYHSETQGKLLTSRFKPQ